jgi:hypothetical protein
VSTVETLLDQPQAAEKEDLSRSKSLLSLGVQVSDWDKPAIIYFLFSASGKLSDRSARHQDGPCEDALMLDLPLALEKKSQKVGPPSYVWFCPAGENLQPINTFHRMARS